MPSAVKIPDTSGHIGQGRIFIKDYLREYAEITDEVVVIGASYKAEIWSKANWEEYNNSISMADIDAALADLVL